jgi:two-component system, NtrC family, sensor kinase
LDLPLRTKLLTGFITVALICGLLTVVAGGLLINNMVIGEAQRRVALGLKTSRAMLDSQLAEAQHTACVLADWVADQHGLQGDGVSEAFLEKAREKCGLDFLHILDTNGVVKATARGDAKGLKIADSPVATAALRQGASASGLRLMPMRELAAESSELAAQAYIRVVETPRAKPGGPTEVGEAMVLEAVSPIVKPGGRIVGVVHLGMVLNRNDDFVDFVRSNIFTEATYKGKGLGTVTIFLGDVRIATNVVAPNGQRAIGTRVSAEVNEQVLQRGQRWIGPAFVVDSWYMSAYEPLQDVAGNTIGILYVGVLKDRYDDMRAWAVGVFLLVALVALVIAAAAGLYLARRLARPITRLTAGAVEIAGGNLDYRLPEPRSAEWDEIKKLTVAFNEMVVALDERDEEVRRSHTELEATAAELKRWNQNYLDTLEFITHELKNQIAAMKINMLAVRDGYIGELTPDQHEAVDDVVVAVNRTEEMILNYLNLSRIEKGELEVRLRPVSLDVDVVRPVVRELKARFNEKSMRVEVDLAADLMVQADSSLLQVVYENLLSNAAKYGREGGLVRVWGRPLNGMWELHVWNEGDGVPPDEVEELFRKFTRLQPPGEQERGTGLGLYINREIVRKHGGDIRAESRHGQWIDFIFTLPRPDELLEERIG